jgi:hypothetical protein
MSIFGTQKKCHTFLQLTAKKRDNVEIHVAECQNSDKHARSAPTLEWTGVWADEMGSKPGIRGPWPGHGGCWSVKQGTHSAGARAAGLNLSRAEERKA